MLRRCVHQGITQRHSRRGNCRQWSSLPASSLAWDPSESDDCEGRVSHGNRTYRPRFLTSFAAAAPLPSAPSITTRRRFSISRHPDPLARHGTINTLDDDEAVAGEADDTKGFVTADDLEMNDLAEGSDAKALLKTMNEMDDFWDDEGVGDDDDNLGLGGGGSDYSDIFGDVSDIVGVSGKGGDDEELSEEAKADAEYRAKQAAIQAELDTRKGRLWDDDWIISDEEWMSNEMFDDMPDWTPAMATRKSVESVKVYEGGVPTLGALAKMTNLPGALPPHPGHGAPKKYASFRGGEIKKRLRTAIQLSIAEDLQKIMKMDSWEDKQEAVDALFEVIEHRVKGRELVLGKLPEFGNMVEKGLEDVLTMVQTRMRKVDARKSKEPVAEGEDESSEVPKVEDEVDAKEIIDVMGVNEEPRIPIFMDVLAAAKQIEQKQQQTTNDEDGTDTTNDGDDASSPKATSPSLSEFFFKSNDAGVPNLVYPLNVHHKDDGAGRMVEEWQLAANKDTKRIMIRDAMKEIADKVVESANCCEDGGEKGAARVFVAGKRGVGKTATLAGIVASARISGHIVVYLPDGDRLRKHGFYIEPCNYRKGLYNLPEIAKEFCEQLLTSHGDDLRGMTGGNVTKEVMKSYLSEDQIRRVFKRAYADDDSVSEEEVASKTELSLAQLLTVGIGSASLASGCYSTVISILMSQTEKPFTVVMDEFNCYYDHGHYFHGDFDENVREAIPLNRITIFKPFMDAMGLYPKEAGTNITESFGDVAAIPSSEAIMKWGSIVVGTSESRAVRGSFTQSLTDAACALSSDNNGEQPPLHVVDIQRYSNVEVQHVLYNYEITGVGRLRWDRGDTALNPEEVEYLRLVSGGTGQQLMDSCMLRL